MKRPRRIAPSWIPHALVCALLLCAQLVHAQSGTDNKAAAEALFDEGLALMRKGDFASACLKLEQSLAIDHGIGTMLYLAECFENSGRTASAWAMFRQAASEAAAAGESARAQAGRQRAERLTPLLSKLTINVPAPAPAGLELTRNGAAVPAALWGVPSPVDPGEQRVEARAPGYMTWTGSAQVGAKSDSVALVVPGLTPAPITAAPPASAPEAAPVAPPSTSAPLAPAPASAPANVAIDRQDAGAGSTQRTLGLVVGAAGVVALGVGSFFGLQAISKNDDAKKHCPGGGAQCDDAQGVALTKDAQSAARLSNVFMVAGVVLAAAGVVTYLVAPAGEQPTLALGSDGRGVHATLGGVF